MLFVALDSSGCFLLYPLLCAGAVVEPLAQFRRAGFGMPVEEIYQSGQFGILAHPFDFLVNQIRPETECAVTLFFG